MTVILRPGIYGGLTPVEYFADPCPAPSFTNSVATKLLNETPSEAAFVHPRLNQDPEIVRSGAAQRMGDIVHQLALGKGRGYEIVDAPTWASNAAKAAREVAEEAGLTPVLAGKFKEAQVMAAIVRTMIEKATRGLPYETEVVIAWEEDTPSGKIWCRGMIDVWCEELLLALDPKITAYLHTPSSHMVNMGWDRQGALYERGLTAIMPDCAGRVRFRDLMIKPKPPHTSLVYGISEAWRTSADLENRRAMNLFSACLYRNEWPAYPDEVIGDQPSWTERKRLEAQMEQDNDA